uniref:Uncharacterized protein n=1 Tax=Panagrolaimus superbus TaxID=310955 RepID=A0A914XXG4_9BILA
MTHKIGERREYFESPKDVWDIFRTLVEEKRKREIDPTLTLLRSILMEAPVNDEEEYGQQRINEMLELIELACGSKVQKVLGFAGKIRKADQTGGRHD